MLVARGRLRTPRGEVSRCAGNRRTWPVHPLSSARKFHRHLPVRLGPRGAPVVRDRREAVARSLGKQPPPPPVSTRTTTHTDRHGHVAASTRSASCYLTHARLSTTFPLPKSSTTRGSPDPARVRASARDHGAAPGATLETTRNNQPSPSPTLEEAPVMAPTAPRKILIVDDKDHVCNALRRSLRKEGYALHYAGVGPGAGDPQAAALRPGPLRSPDANMTGLEFLKRVRDRYPDCMRMMLTGHADLQRHRRDRPGRDLPLPHQALGRHRAQGHAVPGLRAAGPGAREPPAARHGPPPARPAQVAGARAPGHGTIRLPRGSRLRPAAYARPERIF